MGRLRKSDTCRACPTPSSPLDAPSPPTSTTPGKKLPVTVLPRGTNPPPPPAPPRASAFGPNRDEFVTSDEFARKERQRREVEEVAEGVTFAGRFVGRYVGRLVG